MSHVDEELALRKEIIVARCSLSRLKMRQEAATLRRALSWRHAGATVLASPAARDTLFLLAAEGVGRWRTAGWLATAARILAVARLTALALKLLRKQDDRAADQPQP